VAAEGEHAALAEAEGALLTWPVESRDTTIASKRVRLRRTRDPIRIGWAFHRSLDG
jgi:hypothetical protein